MGRPRSDLARQRVLDATLDVVFDVGFDGATIEEIAQRSGVAKSTIYRHFETRISLLSDAARSCLVVWPTPDHGDLSADLTALFSLYDTDENQRLNDLYPMLLDAATRDPQLKSVADELLLERQRPLRTVIKLAQARGEVAPDFDLDVAVALVIGPLTYRRIVMGAEVTSEFVATILPSAIAALRATVPAHS